MLPPRQFLHLTLDVFGSNSEKLTVSILDVRFARKQTFDQPLRFREHRIGRSMGLETPLFARAYRRVGRRTPKHMLPGGAVISIVALCLAMIYLVGRMF